MRTYNTAAAAVCPTPTRREDGDRETYQQPRGCKWGGLGLCGDEGLLSENATASERTVCVSPQIYTDYQRVVITVSFVYLQEDRPGDYVIKNLLQPSCHLLRAFNPADWLCLKQTWVGVRKVSGESAAGFINQIILSCYYTAGLLLSSGNRTYTERLIFWPFSARWKPVAAVSPSQMQTKHSSRHHRPCFSVVQAAARHCRCGDVEQPQQPGCLDLMVTQILAGCLTAFMKTKGIKSSTHTREKSVGLFSSLQSYCVVVDCWIQL